MICGALQDAAALDRYFELALAKSNREYLASLHYAKGLQLMDDPRAEKWFQKAMAVEPQGISDALAYYAEWLLDRGQNDAVVKLVNDKVDLLYAHFLKGVALERLGKTIKAGQAYAKFIEMSRAFPAPVRYRVKGSVSQAGLLFEGDSDLIADVPDVEDGTEAEQSSAKELLATLIACESESESLGAQRAVAWTVRTRVFRAYYVSTVCGGYGSPNGKWGALAQTAKLAAKYNAICSAPGQFSTTRVPATPTSRQVANSVWAGWVPDPIVGACINGDMQPYDDQCGGGCTVKKKSGAFASGPAWMLAAGSNGAGGTQPCPKCHPYVGCTCYSQNPTKPCFNGGIYENCFWRIL